MCARPVIYRKERGVRVIRADTGTARSLEFNAKRIEEAIRLACSPSTLSSPTTASSTSTSINTSTSTTTRAGTSVDTNARSSTCDRVEASYGLVGYSQGCANLLRAECMLKGGTPEQQRLLKGLVTRNLLFRYVLAILGTRRMPVRILVSVRTHTCDTKHLNTCSTVYSSSCIGAFPPLSPVPPSSTNIHTYILYMHVYYFTSVALSVVPPMDLHTLRAVRIS